MNLDGKQITKKSLVQINLGRFVQENILSFRVKNDLLILSGHLARDHKRFGANNLIILDLQKYFSLNLWNVAPFIQ